MAKKLGKALLGLLVQTEEEETTTPTTTESASTTSKAPGVQTSTIVASSASSSGQQDETVVQLLAKAIDDANLPGFDYYEFAQLLSELKASNPSEQALFQTAFASAKVMKASKESLVQSANTYLGILKAKSADFETACQLKIDELVISREKGLKDMDVAIQEKSAAIQKLTEEINAMTAQKTQVTNEIAENRVKIETKRNNFNATLQMYTGRIQGDVEKITKYIQ